MREFFHRRLERSAIGFVLAIIGVSAIGGFVEIAPLFTINETVEKAPDMRVYTPLELAGRNIYIREGCYACHSQMIRTLRDEVERYGPYSLAVESKYDHPMLWGSKRTGPDIARLGGKYSDAWHVAHLINPRDVVPQSVMPNYPWLATTPLDYSDIEKRMLALRTTGVPYSKTNAEYERNVKEFGETVAKSLHIPDAEKNLIAQAQLGNYDTNPENVTEMDALVAYLQMLGTLVDFKKYDDDYFVKFR